MQEHVDRYVSEHPGTFGLGSLPIKGTAGRHFFEKAERARVERPPEPLHEAGLGRGGGVRRRGALRRPGFREEGDDAAAGSHREQWLIPAHEVDVLLLGVRETVAFEKAFYYQQECKLAGEVKEIDIREVTLKVKLTGTTHEGVLKLQSGRPELLFRVHRCGPTCKQEEVADDLAPLQG